MTESALERLLGVMRKLRDPQGGCPWDLEQDWRSLAPFTLEEAYEVVELLERDQLDALKDELGDLLFQVVFLSQMAAEEGRFTFQDVAAAIADKLTRRHPHVFGAEKLGTSEQVLVQWEQIKAQEKKHGPVATGVFKDLPPRLPALMFAEAVWKQIEKKSLPVGGVVDVAQVRALGSKLTEAELGKMLFEVTAAARSSGLDPEGALRLYATKVMRDVEAQTPSA